MVVKNYIKSLGYGIKSMLGLQREEISRKPESIYCCIINVYSQVLTVLVDKADIKRNIMAYKNRVLTELHKLRNNHFPCRSIHYHLIIDTGELLNPVWNRNLRIDKLRESLNDLAVTYLNSTDLDNLILNRRKSCCFYIKYDKGSVIKWLSLVVNYDFLEIINKISLYAQDKFKEILPLYRWLSCLFPAFALS